MLPTFIRSRKTPPLLGISLLHHVNVLQYLLPGIESLQRIDRIHIASRAVIVTKHFHPVVDPTHHQLRGKNIRDRPIGKGDVNLRIILDIVIPRPQKTFIAIIRQARDLVRAGADRGRANGHTIARFSFDPLQVKRGAYRMASLPHHRTTAGKFPDPIVGRVGSPMRLLPQNPEYLRAALLHDFPFLLNHRSIDPVLGIANQFAAGFGRSQNARTAGCGLGQHQGLGGRTSTVKSGERLFNNDVLTQAERLDGKFFVGGRRRA